MTIRGRGVLDVRLKGPAVLFARAPRRRSLSLPRREVPWVPGIPNPGRTATIHAGRRQRVPRVRGPQAELRHPAVPQVSPAAQHAAVLQAAQLLRTLRRPPTAGAHGVPTTPDLRFTARSALDAHPAIPVPHRAR